MVKSKFELKVLFAIVGMIAIGAELMLLTGDVLSSFAGACFATGLCYVISEASDVFACIEKCIEKLPDDVDECNYDCESDYDYDERGEY